MIHITRRPIAGWAAAVLCLMASAASVSAQTGSGNNSDFTGNNASGAGGVSGSQTANTVGTNTATTSTISTAISTTTTTTTGGVVALPDVTTGGSQESTSTAPGGQQSSQQRVRQRLVLVTATPAPQPDAQQFSLSLGSDGSESGPSAGSSMPASVQAEQGGLSAPVQRNDVSIIRYEAVAENVEVTVGFLLEKAFGRSTVSRLIREGVITRDELSRLVGSR